LDTATTLHISLEDADYEALEKIMKASRWNIRDKELSTLLENFENGVYKKEEEKKPDKK